MLALLRASLGDTLPGPPSVIWCIRAENPPLADAPSSHPKVADVPNTEREKPKIACLSPHAKSQPTRMDQPPTPIQTSATSSPSPSSPASKGEYSVPVFVLFSAEGGEGGCSHGVRVERERRTRSGRRVFLLCALVRLSTTDPRPHARRRPSPACLPPLTCPTTADTRSPARCRPRPPGHRRPSAPRPPSPLDSSPAVMPASCIRDRLLHPSAEKGSSRKESVHLRREKIVVRYLHCFYVY